MDKIFQIGLDIMMLECILVVEKGRVIYLPFKLKSCLNFAITSERIQNYIKGKDRGNHLKY